MALVRADGQMAVAGVRLAIRFRTLSTTCRG